MKCRDEVVEMMMQWWMMMTFHDGVMFNATGCSQIENDGLNDVEVDDKMKFDVAILGDEDIR